jgi:hypothetical protein
VITARPPGRRATARRWVALRAAAVGGEALGPPVTPPSPRRPSSARVFIALARRYFLAKLRDTAGMAVFLLQPLLLATVLALVFSRPTSGLVFMLSLSAMWFGMSAAVRELIADRAMADRERRVGVPVLAAMGSKALVLSVIVALQCAVFVLLVGAAVGLPGFSMPALVGAAVLTGWTGAATGLLVSAFWRSSAAAVGTIVLLLVPEIAFSGVLMPLSELGPVGAALASVNPERYAFDLALRASEQLSYLRLGDWHERPTSGELFLLGLRPAGEGVPGLAPATLAAVLAGFVVVQLTAALVVQARRR